MPMNSFKPVRQLFNKDGELQQLLVQAERLQKATRALHAQLPPPLEQHCKVANIKGELAVLHADSPAWAAKLRFHVAGILQQLRKQPGLGALQAIRIKVSPLDDPQPPSAVARPVLSEQAGAVLRSAADATADPALKAVLLRLAQRQRQDTRYKRKEES